MHAMWSRAAQVQSSCRCRLCMHTTSTLVRRSTSSASRRKVTPADFFTACYTTILGTAAILDAHRKDARRKELDEKLERAKAASSSPGSQGGLLNEQFDRADGTASSTSKGRMTNSSLRWRRVNEKTTSSLLHELAALCDITRTPSGRSSWLQDQIDWVRVEATIVAEENDPELVLREPINSTFLKMTTATVMHLVEDLLEQNRIRGNSDQGGGEISKQLTEAEEAILNDLDKIRSGLHYPGYEQPTLDLARSRDARSLLSESIRRIFNQASSSIEVVGKICYNLLVSSSPPTIHTYNALIAGFNRIKRPDLAQVVIDSYIYDTAWPATQQTMVCLLNHYRITSDIHGLRDVIARMRGVKDTGMHFCIISKESIYSKDWLEWASNHCASRKYAFVKRAHRGPEVFDSIIKGWLHHKNLSAASMIFIACVRNGSSISTQTLHRLLTACLAAVDHATARQMVKGIIKNLRNFVFMFDRTLRESTAAVSLNIIDSLSKLIHICGLPLHGASDIVNDAHQRQLRQLVRFMSTTKIHLELHASARLCWRVFGIVDSPGPLLPRLEAAVKIVNATQWDRKAFHNYDMVARLLSIDKRYQDLQRKGKAMANQAKALILKLKTGLDFDPASLLASEKHEKPIKQYRYLALNSALEHLDLDDGPLTQSRVKTQFVEGMPNPHLARRFRLAGRWDEMPPSVLTSFYGPSAVTFHCPDNSDLSFAIRKAEKKLIDSEDFIKVILFSYIGVDRQKWLRTRYPNWYTMPVEPLVDYHMRRRRRGPSTVVKQEGTEYAAVDTKQNTFFPAPPLNKELDMRWSIWSRIPFFQDKSNRLERWLSIVQRLKVKVQLNIKRWWTGS